MSFVLQENYQLFVDLNRYAGRWSLLDGLMIFCATTLIFLWPLLLLCLWGRPLRWRQRPLRPGERELVQECRAIVLWVGGACLLSYLFNLAIEQVVFEPRPFVTHHVHVLIAHAADASFPSDHAAWSFAVVGMILFSLPFQMLSTWRQKSAINKGSGLIGSVLPLILMGCALLIACSIGIARIFVGVHYPGDIVGGALSGLAAAAIITLLRQRFSSVTQALVGLAQHLRLV